MDFGDTPATWWSILAALVVVVGGGLSSPLTAWDRTTTLARQPRAMVRPLRVRYRVKGATSGSFEAPTPMPRPAELCQRPLSNEKSRIVRAGLAFIGDPETRLWAWSSAKCSSVESPH
jgi:hypothetical protein